MAKQDGNDKIPSFPVWFHKGSGQWCEKVHGRNCYFGTEKYEALKRYIRGRDDLEAGRTPRPEAGNLPLSDLLNAFLNQRRERMESGELTRNSWDGYRLAGGRLVECFGAGRSGQDIRPADFAKLRNDLSKTLGPAALSRFITQVKTIFRFAVDSEMIAVPLRFGDGFAKPPQRVMRLAKNKKGRQLITAADAWKSTDAADAQVKAMILLGLNAGIGSKDCSGLAWPALDKRPGWLVFPREKTGINPVCKLWPEALDAPGEVRLMRPAAKLEEDAGQVFITRYGNRFCRLPEPDGGGRGSSLDACAQSFRKLCKKTGVAVVGGPYTLRRTHRTVSDGGASVPFLRLLNLAGRRFVAEVPVNFTVRDAAGGPGRRPADGRRRPTRPPPSRPAPDRRRFRLAGDDGPRVGRRPGARVAGGDRGDGRGDVFPDQRGGDAGPASRGRGVPALDGRACVPARQTGGRASGLRGPGLRQPNPASDAGADRHGLRHPPRGAAAGGKIRTSRPSRGAGR